GLQRCLGRFRTKHPSTAPRNNRTILPWICWSLGTARNTLIFENRQITQEEVATKGMRLAREWCLAQKPKGQGENLSPGNRKQKARPIADTQTPICRSDAAWDKASNKAGLAWIISGADNNIKKQGSTHQEHVSSPLVAEALALRLGIIAAANLDLPKIRMLSDNQTLIRAINNDIQIKEIFGIVKDIHQISTVFVDIS
ncbi:unnamed protein product, partial [Brassica rapa]